MKLGKKQETFSILLSVLLVKAGSLGFEVRVGDLFRDPRAFGEFGTNTILNIHGDIVAKAPYGREFSMHKLKLAVDLNLFMPDGEYLNLTEHHKELGQWWKTMDEDARWGGDFGSKDGNHYSLTHWGHR